MDRFRRGAAVLLALLALTCSKDAPDLFPQDPLVNPRIAPNVVSAVPALNSLGPYAVWDASLLGPFVELRFNKRMHVPSVAGALRVASSWQTLAQDSNDVTTADGVTFRLYLRGLFSSPRFRVREVLTVALARDVADVNGNVLRAAVLGVIVPEPSFRVRFMLPADGAEVEPNSAATLALGFNAKVGASILRHLAVTPGPAPDWSYSPDSTLVRTTIAVTIPGEPWTVSIDAGAADAAGEAIGAPYLGRFRAVPFAIAWAAPYDTVDVPLNHRYSFNTVYPASAASIAGACHITPEIVGGFMIVQSPGSTYAEFVPAVEYRPTTRYTIRVDTSLRTEGGFPLGSEFAFTFQTAAFRLEFPSPPDGATGVDVSSTLSVFANAELDTSSAAGSIHIDPAVDAMAVSVSGNALTVVPSPMRPYTRYAVTLDTTLKSKGGAALTAPFTFRFTTGGL
jgi:hypothetical protein